MKFSILGVAALVMVPATVSAHDRYIQNRFGSYTIVSGHGAAGDDSYSADKVSNIMAHGADGSAVSAAPVDKGDYVAFEIGEDANALAGTFASGFWTKDTDGKWHNMPKSEVSNPEKSGEYFAHSTAVIGEGESLTPFGLPLEIVPNANPIDMKAGASFEVTVLLNGAPLADAEIGSLFDDEFEAKTDENGVAQVPVAEGYNTLTVRHTVDHPDQSKADNLTHSASLSFVPHDDHHH